MRKKVLKLRAGGGYFGVENVIIELSKELAHTDYQPIVGVLENSRNPLSTELARVAEKHNIETAIFKCKRRLDTGTILAIRSFIKQNRIAIVHSHDYKANFYALAGSLFQDIPLVATCHPWAASTYSVKGKWYATLDKLLLPKFAKVVAVCAEVKREIEACGISESKLAVIENGIDVSRFAMRVDKDAARKQLSIPANKRIIGTVGRLSEEKGHRLFLQAAKLLLDRFEDLFFLIVGDGRLRRELEKSTIELGLKNDVRFLGSYNDIPMVLALMEVFVLPSLSEGLPMALLEAMAAKKPIVATRVGAVPRIVNGECGITVDPDGHNLAKAIAAILSNNDRAILLAENGYNKVTKEFSSERMAREYVAIYDGL